MNELEPAFLLTSDPRWRWRAGMKERGGRRIEDPQTPSEGAIPDLDDFATAGELLGALDEMNALTDVVRSGNDWVVAVDMSGKIQGFVSDTLGEAAGWAIVKYWEHVDLMRAMSIGEA